MRCMFCNCELSEHEIDLYGFACRDHAPLLGRVEEDAADTAVLYTNKSVYDEEEDEDTDFIPDSFEELNFNDN